MTDQRLGDAILKNLQYETQKNLDEMSGEILAHICFQGAG